MAKWTPFPHAGDYRFDAASVKKQWARLHGGDAEPCPKDSAVLEAWALFHNGDFEKATAAGLAAGGAGITVANKATSIYANYLEPKEKARLDLFMQVAERAEAQATQEPDNANAWYWHAYALGRYSQGISVAKALAQGLGGKVKATLVDARDIQAQAVKVISERGTVYLMGRVTEREANRASDVARSINGVQKVIRVFEIVTEAQLASMK